MARIRSPNYPAISLPSAIERVKAIHKNEGKNAASREALAKAIGFGGLNGASATSLSALAKYGLIEAVGDGEAKVTELAMRMIAADTPEERQEAIQEAAFRPTLFAAIREKWPDRSPSDDSLRSFLVRGGFSQGALEQVIQVYRDTSDMVSPSRREHTSPPESREMNMHATVGSTLEACAVRVPGKAFSIAFDGSALTGSINIRSVRDFDRYMKVLQAQRVVLETMQDDDLDEGSNQSDPDQTRVSGTVVQHPALTDA